MRILFAFFLLLFSALHANWEEHLRKCEGKGGDHSIPEIDFIYMMNLKQRPQKWEACLRQLTPYGIDPYRFEAINGWELDEEIFHTLGCPDLHPGMPPGKIGCLLSHLSILHDAYQSGYKTIWLMEDDIEVIEDPRQIPSLIHSLDQLVDDWDILYTDYETKDFFGNRVPCMAIYPRPNLRPKPMRFYLRRIPIDETFLEIGMRYGCYSMIIRRSGIEKILNYFITYRLYLPTDMELFFVPGLKQITLFRDIVSTRPGTPSDTTYLLPYD
jgi:GR25 family glycosyltransferase involved in LPS biosynthesis